MKHICVLMTLATLCFPVSCKKNESAPVSPTLQAAIVPLKIGNTWTYAQTVLDTSGNVLSSGGFTDSVIKDTTALGKTLFCATTDGARSPIYSTSLPAWLINTDSGLVRVRDFLASAYQLDYKYPASTGDFFVRYDLAGRVTATNVALQVPAGNFICVKYEFFYGSLRIFDAFVAESVGEVKFVTYFNRIVGPTTVISYIASTSTLTRYSLK